MLNLRLGNVSNFQCSYSSTNPASYLEEESKSEYVGRGVEEARLGGIRGHPEEVGLQQNFHILSENQIAADIKNPLALVFFFDGGGAEIRLT